MQKFASIVEDQEWNDILINMNNDINAIRISDVETKFLENVTLLEQFKAMGIGCEALSRYTEIATEGWFTDLWDKIKKFFVDLWNRFVNFIKNIPNYIRPYINRLNAVRNRVGMDLNITKAQEVLTLSIPDLIKRSTDSSRYNVKLVNNVPTLLCGDVPIRTMVNQMETLTKMSISDNHLYCQYCDMLIETYNMFHQYIGQVEKQFRDVLEEFKTSNQENNITDVDYKEIVEGFNKDLLYITNFEKLMIESAKNLCKIQFNN